MTELIADLHINPLEPPDPPEPDSWTPVNLNTLPDKPPIQPDLGNTGLLYPGKRHVFSGPPDSAKTIAAYCVLIAVIRTNATVALIDFEMGGYDARQRLQELGATTDELDSVLYVEPAERATTERITALVQLEPALVVVDAAAGAYNIQGLDDNKRGDVETLSALYVNAFWRNNIATLFIDHVVKDAESRGRYAIGSERKLGGVDVHYGFDTITPVSRGTSGRYKLIIHRDRGGYLPRGHIADLHLDSDPDTHEIAWAFTEIQDETAPATEGGYFRPTRLMEKVSIDLENRPDPVTRNTIAITLGGTKSYVLQAVDALVREGFVTETSGSNRSKLLTSARRYRENDPESNEPHIGGSGGSASGSEPLKPNNEQRLPEQTPQVVRPNDDLAQPSGSSVVRQWFGSGSANRLSGGGSTPPSYGGGVTRTTHNDHQEPLGWFGTTDGSLTDSYYDEIAPDDDDIPS